MAGKTTVKAFLCTLLILLASSNTTAINVDRLILSPEPAKFSEDFNLKAYLEGDTCNVVATFYIDGFQYAVKNVVAPECDAKDVDARWSQNEWDKYNLKCGVHTARVELTMMGQLMDNYTKQVDIGIVPNISFIPETPTVDREFRVAFRDPKTDRLITGLGVNIVEVSTGTSSSRDTGGSGEITFSTKNPGLYRLVFNKREYCGEIEFYVKRTMLVDGPRPNNPVVDEPIQLGVPQGSAVGIKILDTEGNVYKIVPVSIAGGANFTISDPGNYTIIIGDQSTKYWPMNKSIIVYSRPVPEITVFPTQPVAGKPVTISVASRGAPLDAATITITKPDGVSKEFTSNSDGKVTYDGASATGRYIVRADKARYDSVSGSFEAYYGFTVSTEPANPTVNDTIVLSIRNQDGMGVGDVQVAIPKVSYSGYTNNEGKVNLNLHQPGDYDLVINKARYWNTTQTISIDGILSVDLSSYEIELGQSVEINSSTSFGDPIESSIKIGDPSGLTKTNNGISYLLTPDAPGDYKIILEKRDYLSANATLKVSPHPLQVVCVIKDGSILVNVTSHEAGVSGLKVSASLGDFSSDATTNGEGIVQFPVKSDGQLKVDVNVGDGKNSEYDTKSQTQEVVKSYNIWLLLVPLIIILFTAAFVVIILQVLKKGDIGGRGGSAIKRIKSDGSAFMRSGSQRLSKL